MCSLNNTKLDDIKHVEAPQESKTFMIRAKCEKVLYKKQYMTYGISRELTNMICNRMKENIFNLFPYMIKAIELHDTNNEFNNGNIRICTYDLHDKTTNEPLYFVLQKTKNNNHNFKWNMMNRIFIAKDIENQYGIAQHKLPKLWKLRKEFKLQKTVKDKIISFIDNNEDIFKLKKVKWKQVRDKIRIYNKLQNKRRITIGLSKDEFLNEIKQFRIATKNSDNLIQIMMPNSNGNGHHIEFVQFIKLRFNLENNNDVIITDIGLAYQYVANKVKLVGIHLDKHFIQSQHQLISKSHECDCFVNIQTNIDFLTIGNPDYFKNNMNRYKSHKLFSGKNVEGIAQITVQNATIFDKKNVKNENKIKVEELKTSLNPFAASFVPKASLQLSTINEGKILNDTSIEETKNSMISKSDPQTNHTHNVIEQIIQQSKQESADNGSMTQSRNTNKMFGDQSTSKNYCVKTFPRTKQKYLHQQEIDTSVGQSGSVIWFKENNNTNSNAATTIFGLHTGGNRDNMYNVATLVDNFILKKVEQIRVENEVIDAINYQNGNKYVGQTNQSGKRHGYGKLVFTNGNIYQGNWLNGKKHGHGIFIWNSGEWKGDIYEGEFKDGFREGKGKYVYANGDIYEGNWLNGKQNGHGKYLYINGDVYDGWKDSKKHGNEKQNKLRELVKNYIECQRQILDYIKDDHLDSIKGIRKAWLSVESMIKEINVSDGYFVISGVVNTFWIDKDCSLMINGQKFVNASDNRLPEWEYKLDDKTQKFIKLTQKLPYIMKKYIFPFGIDRDNKFILFENDVRTDVTSEPDLIYNYTECVFKLQITFTAKFEESFENNHADFPFECQFLNIKIPYNHQYYFKDTIPEEVKRGFCFEKYWPDCDIYPQLVLVRKIQAMKEWNLLAPWVDFRKIRKEYNHEFDYGLIKLRVRRNPIWHMLYIVIPLFLMGACSFATFMIDQQDISDRLTYIVTLLLTITSFQCSVGEYLPFKSQFTLIDHYFLLAYFLLTALILETCIFATDWKWKFDEDLLEKSFAGLLAFFWMAYSMQFLIKYSRNSQSCNVCFETFFGCCCKTRRNKTHLTHWLKMEKGESQEFDNRRKFGDESICFREL
eukprot:11135_1